MSQYTDGTRKTFTAGSALNAHVRVKITAATGAYGPTVGLAGASDPSIGVTEFYTASGDPVTIHLANAPGTRKMLGTAAAITANNPVYAAASGFVASTGTVVEGKAMETTAGASGDVLEVMPQPNSDIATAIAGTTNVTFAVDTDATTPKIALSGQAAGSGDFTTTLKPESTLSANTGIIVPESTDGDVLMCLALAQTVSAIKTHSADVIIQTASDLALGTTSDALLRFSAADASDPALVLALDDTSQQMHITDKAAVATDWARSAGTHPEVSIHSNTTPITDYLAIGNHDGTTASIDVVGGTTLDLKIAGTAALTVTAATTTVVGRLAATACVANTAGVGITGTADSYVTSVEKIGSIIKTTILIEVDGLNGGGTAADIIGADGAGVAHLGQITAAVNGTIFAGKITCLETPTGSNADIDLWYADESTGVEDTAISALTGETQCINHGAWTEGEMAVLTAFPAADKYLYLTSGTATDATFTAGILLIELYGK